MQNENYDLNRSMRSRHIQNLARKMENGEFKSGSVIHFAKIGGGYVLMDGQHRLSAVIKSKKPMEFVCVYNEYKDRKSMREAYSVIDTNLKRSVHDYIKSRNLTSQIPISKTNLSFMFSALRQTFSRFYGLDRDSMTNEDLEKFAFLFKEEVIELSELLERLPSDRIFIRLAGLLGVMLYTLKHWNEKARPFWKRFLHSEDFKSDDPRKVLLNFLEKMRNDLRVGRLTTTKVKVKGTEIAWNAYVSGQKITSIKIDDPNVLDFKGIDVDELKELELIKMRLPELEKAFKKTMR